MIQPTLFDLPTTNAPKRADKKPTHAIAQKTASVIIAKSLSDALKCTTSGLCLICEEWPTFDLNDRAYFTPDSGKYIEAERLPSAWLPLVGKTVCADRITVGTIADLLEELPPKVAEEWRELYANCESDEGDKALCDFEEAHRIKWYGEGYYLDNDNKESESEVRHE